MSTILEAPIERPVLQGNLVTEDDLYLFNEGTHYELWKKLGSHVVRDQDRVGTHFAVWAPNARSVSVIGDFNDWCYDCHPLRQRGRSGIWEGFIPDVDVGTRYKYHIASRANGYSVNKADPLGFRHETTAGRASIVWNLDYDWQDDAWMRVRGERNRLSAPMSIYEMHIGSRRRGAPRNTHPLYSLAPVD